MSTSLFEIVVHPVVKQDSYLSDGYCVVTFPLRMDLIMTLVCRASAPMDEWLVSTSQLCLGFDSLLWEFRKETSSYYHLVEEILVCLRKVLMFDLRSSEWVLHCWLSMVCMLWRIWH